MRGWEGLIGGATWGPSVRWSGGEDAGAERAVEVLLAVSGGAGRARWSGGEDVVVVKHAGGSCRRQGRGGGRLERARENLGPWPFSRSEGGALADPHVSGRDRILWRTVGRVRHRKEGFCGAPLEGCAREMRDIFFLQKIKFLLNLKKENTHICYSF